MISRWSPDLVFIIFMTMKSDPGQCPFTLDDAFFPVAHEGRGSLIVCVWGCCPWGQKNTCKRGPIWRALSAADGGEKNFKGIGETAVHGAKRLRTRKDDIMPVVNRWIPWLVYVVVWYICDKLPYIRFYGFGIILLVFTDYNI